MWKDLEVSHRGQTLLVASIFLGKGKTIGENHENIVQGNAGVGRGSNR
jgi:hypothetical protein